MGSVWRQAEQRLRGWIGGAGRTAAPGTRVFVGGMPERSRPQVLARSDGVLDGDGGVANGGGQSSDLNARSSVASRWPQGDLEQGVERALVERGKTGGASQ